MDVLTNMLREKADVLDSNIYYVLWNLMVYDKFSSEDTHLIYPKHRFIVFRKGKREILIFIKHVLLTWMGLHG